MPDDIFGNIDLPEGVAKYDAQAGGGTIGLLGFFSNILNLFTIVMGLYVLYNFIMAGYLYITSAGDSGAHTKVKDKVTWSVVGLAVIVMAYTITGIIGLVFFGDAGFILNPTIIGPDARQNILHGTMGL